MTNRINQTPTLYLMAGAAGAGKGYVIRNDAILSTLPVVNADHFKESHPEYDPKNPAPLHAWSSQQATRTFYAKLGAGESFIFDGTGTTAEKYVGFIHAAHAAGFKAEVVYVKVSLKTSLTRNAARSRNVPENVVREQHGRIGNAIEILAGYADNVIVVNND